MFHLPTSNVKMDKKNDLEDLINQLPPPIVLLGDFNAHSTEWGCSKNDSKGKMISDIMLQRNLSLLKDGSATYLHPGSGSQSAIDLSICDPLLYLDFSWKVHDDLCGSDHFPIIIYSDRAVPSVTNSIFIAVRRSPLATPAATHTSFTQCQPLT